MEEGVRRVEVKPEFQRQLNRRLVDKRAEEIRKEAEEKKAELRRKGLMKYSLDARLDEVKLVTESRIVTLYQLFYNRRLNIAKGNIASFYSNLYQSIFGGKVLRKFKTEKEEYENGDEKERRNFHPDHIRYAGDTKIFCEVKAVSDKNSKPMCSSRQLENYCHDLLTDAFETMFTPELEYAFFRYVHRGTHDDKTSVLTNQRLAQKLSRDTKDLLIVPANVFFLLTLASKGCWMNQESNKGPDEAHYWKIYGNLITRFNRKDNPVLEVARQLPAEGDLITELCLGDVGVDRFESPGNLYCRGQRIKPFQITRYYNRTSQWQEYFKTNHGRVLTEILRVRDLYEELHGVPF